MEITNNNSIVKSIDIESETTKNSDLKTEASEKCGKQQFEEVMSKLQDSKPDKS